MPITGLRDDVLEYASAVAQAAAEAYLADAVEAAPELSGELKRSARGPDLRLVGETTIRAVVGFDAPQADWTDQSTAPHRIEARNAPVLRFYWEDGPDGPGMYVFAHVNHPGVQDTRGWFSERESMWETYVDDAAAGGGASSVPPINSLSS